jgi:hypothetical protein
MPGGPSAQGTALLVDRPELRPEPECLLEVVSDNFLDLVTREPDDSWSQSAKRSCMPARVRLSRRS